MTLVLEIEYLLGVAFAAQSPAISAPDWPPQPDRVFSALVAAWGARGERADERRALEWLEAQPAPTLAASGGFARTAATVFVPPNDPETRRVADRSVMPAFRRRQPRRFPAYRPDDPIVRLVWRDIEAGVEILAALNALACNAPYVGHSASLTRCLFRADGAPEHADKARRRVYKGRLTELENVYRVGGRPGPGDDVRAESAKETNVARSVFSGRWLVLEHIDGEMPDLRAAALVAKALRCALMSGYKKTGSQSVIPAEVSGHTADGSPLAEPHLAIAPLAFLGPQYADGRVFGFALIPPGEGELLDEDGFQRAVRAIAPLNEREGRRELKLTGNGFKLAFTLSGQGARRSQNPEPYVALAKTWATCTPIVLDRHLKATKSAERDREKRQLIAQACRNIGLPEPAGAGGGEEAREGLAIAAGKHPAVNGAPSAYPSGHAPTWTSWRLPKSLASRPLTHAVLQFDQPVRGPVILGAGRYVGLGLCRALDPEER